MSELTYSFLTRTREEAEAALAQALAFPESRAKAEAHLGYPIGEYRISPARVLQSPSNPGFRRWEWDVEFPR
jgi:hypothetical protein